MLLDSELRIVLVSEEAKALLGFEPSLGAAAAKVLCQNSPQRPVVEALSHGRAVSTVIPHPRASALARGLSVRALPLGNAGPPRGWLLLLEDAGSFTREPVLFHGMWTQAARMKQIIRIIERVAQEEVTVLVRGETGTGKELVAQAIHALSARSRGPLRAINCAALPASLLESELFGHVRGAFTGAIADAPGHFQLADKGTLFLDEVGEMPLELQAKLLRVLETRSVLPVGGRKAVPVDVRIVSATHRALRAEVEAGRFRADLMYRLRVIPVFLPALRERKEDIGLLCSKFMEGMNQSARRRFERLSPSAYSLLERYGWPGNVRELKNVLAYAYAIGEGPILQASDLPPELVEGVLGLGEAAQAQSNPEPEIDPELRGLLEVLAKAKGNKNRAAKILGISRVTLWRRLKAFGLDPSGAPR